MSKLIRETKYFLNGKETPYNSIKKRNGKLNEITIVTSKFYTCELTEQEEVIINKGKVIRGNNILGFQG